MDITDALDWAKAVRLLALLRVFLKEQASRTAEMEALLSHFGPALAILRPSNASAG